MNLKASLEGLFDCQHISIARWQDHHELHSLILRTPGKEIHAEADHLIAVLSESHIAAVIAASDPDSPELPALHDAQAWLRGADDRSLVYSANGQ